MHKSFVAAALAAALLAGTASAQIQGPPIQPQQQLPPNTGPLPGLRPPCGGAVDLAIARATLYKGSAPGRARVVFDVVNRGPGEWNSTRAQQSASLVVRNGNTGAEFTRTVSIGGARYAAGAVVARVNSGLIANAFDPFEFSGTVRMSLAFDPDLYIDGNRCNDDSNRTNNTFEIGSDGVQAFLGGAAPSRTFSNP